VGTKQVYDNSMADESFYLMASLLFLK